MQQENYKTMVDQLFFDLEDVLISAQPEVDWDIQEGGLSILFQDGSQLVITRQLALKEVWLASKQGAHHFQWVNGEWQTAQGEALMAILKKIFKHYQIEVSL